MHAQTTDVIHTIAGNGTAGYNGDGIPATSAELNYPSSLIFDSAGNLYFSDLLNSRVRKIDTAGNVTTVAGNGTAGYSGDGGPATSAELSGPYGLAFDQAGNLYFTETGNNIVRKIDFSALPPTIATVVGTGTQGYSGDGGPAINATLRNPFGLVFDTAGNLYVADSLNNRIRKIDTATGIITTIAGTGTSGSSGGGLGSYGGDGGPAIDARMNNPEGLAFDSAGNLYVSDIYNNRIRKLSLDSANTIDTDSIITTVAGSGTQGYAGDGGPAGNAGLYYPFGLAFDTAGNLFIADEYTNRIRKVSVDPATSTIDADSIITTVAGNGTPGYSGDGGPAIDAGLNTPYGVAFDGTGRLYLADTFDHRIRRLDAPQAGTDPAPVPLDARWMLAALAGALLTMAATRRARASPSAQG